MKIAILGLGTMGYGVYELIQKREDIQVARVLDVKTWMENMTTHIEDIVNDDQIECVVETMGGIEPAHEYARACILSGKSYVTANKKLLSVYGEELHKLALEKGVGFRFSAACGGGIAYLANLCAAREYDKITAVGGVVNGTTNYILDRVQREGIPYQEALSDAQALGYAERDPSSDVMGLDSMQKLILSCAVAYGVWLNPDDIPVAGIQNLLDADLAYIREMGRVARLVVRASRTEKGVCAYVEPRLLPLDEQECSIRLNLNYAWYEGEYGGRMGFMGQGAGRYPTAANIVNDIVRLMKGDAKMLKDDMALVKNNASDASAYYARIPLEKWDESLNAIVGARAQAGKWLLIKTIPMTANDMHRIMKQYSGAFFASIA